MKYFRYHNTNCYFLTGKSGKLMAFDAGWPCTLYEYGRMMKTIGLRYESVAWAVVSHMHMDHAGLLSEFLNSGIECFVFDDQFETIDGMERIILKNKEYQSYKKIDKEKVNRISIESFNEVCKQIEVHGEAVKTVPRPPIFPLLANLTYHSSPVLCSALCQ